MRTCPKCGSYVPDGKLLCEACNRPVVGLSGNAKQTTLHEKKQTHARIEKAFEQTELKVFFRRDNTNPYHGNTYEQHRSHDPNSKDYYKSKYQAAAKTVPASGENVLCLFAYLGFFFFVPLMLLPNSKFARFHANQGLVLFLLNIALGIVEGIGNELIGYDVLGLLSVIPVFLMGYGIANALRGEMKPLPLVGHLQLIKENDNRFGGGRWGR